MERLTTGVPGLDEVLAGGLPVGAIVLVSGPPGAGKTVLTEQIVFGHAARGRRALVLTTLSEPHDKLIRFTGGFAWFDRARLGNEVQYLSLYEASREAGLPAVLELVVRTVRERQATLLVIDSFRSLRDLAESEAAMRRFLFELGGMLGLLSVTVLLAGEYARAEEHAYPEFTLVDGIVHLSNEPLGTRQIRGLEVVKMRGTAHLAGRHSLEIGPAGMTVSPRQAAVARVLPYELGAGRAATGVPDLDAMLGGGLVRHSISAITGPAGTGKTLLGLCFLAEGARHGEPGILLSFDEGPAHLEAKAKAFGLSEGRLFDGGPLRMLWTPAVELDANAVAARLRDAVERYRPRRLVIDGAAVLEKLVDRVELSDFVTSLVGYLRHHGVTTLLLQETPDLETAGPVSLASVTGAAVVDNSVLLRRVELNGALQRAIAVVNARDSAFDTAMRLYTIDRRGVRIGEPLDGMAGTFAGVAVKVTRRAAAGRSRTEPGA